MSTPGEGTRLVRALRLRNQGLVAGGPTWRSAADVARGMVAMQAQDREGVLLALSLRSRDRPTAEAVAAELASGAVVRNRPSRGTLQVTAPEDLHWLTALLAPRSNAAAVKRRAQIGLTDDMVEAAGEVLRAELAGGRIRTRPELVAACAAGGVELDGSQAGHVLRHHTERMTIVVAGPPGRVDSFALADDWITDRRDPGDEALGELATRFFTARGPATAQCLGWWSNLAMGDVRRAIAAAGPALSELTVDGTTHLVATASAGLDPGDVDDALAPPLLLPPFDEYLLGYRNREAVVTAERLDAIVPGRNGMFKPIVVVAGQVVGLWSRKATARTVTVTVQPFERLGSNALAGLAQRVEEYGAHLGRAASMVLDR